MKISFFSYGNNTLFHKEGFELGLILKMRVLELGNGLFYGHSFY